MNLKKWCIGIGFVIFAALINACNSGDASPEAYRKSVNNWHQKRIESLTQKDSWLSLAGLYWLNEGDNSFGSDSTNDIVFPPKAPPRIGTFTLKDSSVTATITSGVSVKSDSAIVHSTSLKADVTGDPTILHQGTLSWYVIKRGDQWGIRLKDSKNEVLQNFKGIERFPVQEKWRVKAKFSSYDSLHTLNVPTVLGESAAMQIPGTLHFNIDEKKYSFLPILEAPDSDEWFIVFGDRTNGDETYGGGRFIYIDKAADENTTYIDFNKAYNPPCAFTSFATCPLPPPENKLPIAVKAGEKKYGENPHHH